MFAVKGWSVSADKPKTETATIGGPGAPAKKSKKRKRPGNSNGSNSKNIEVTAANVADLWEKVIEHKDTKAQRKTGLSNHDKKRQKLELAAKVTGENGEEQEKAKKTKKSKKDKQQPGSKPNPALVKDTPAGNQDAAGETGDDEWNGIDDESNSPPRVKEKRFKNKVSTVDSAPSVDKKSGKSKKDKSKPEDPAQETAKLTAPVTPPAPATPKLTPLQASMRKKLISARFRHLNETLYTRPSAEAFRLFQENPDMFGEYHEGFRRQVDVWPENPVAGYIADIKARAKVRPTRDNRNRQQRPGAKPALLPLPRTQSVCTIADLGCGDAALAAALHPLRGKLGLDLRSFDLQTGGSALVTRADVANLPLPDGSVDVAIFCLALMGTNWVGFVEEAWRVLRWKGELWVAEIKSRFAAPGKGRKVVEHSVGHRRNPGAAAAGGGDGKKGKKGDGDDAAAADLAIEVDGAEDRRHETDVSAFVEVLRRRGFALRGEPAEAIDLSNKMFVKLHFVKAAAPERGKGVNAAADLRGGGQGQQQKKRFITADEADVGPADEAAVLKPCLYKVR